MAAALPAELKPLKRFIREANKTAKAVPVISYYCRLYAIQEAMKMDKPSTKPWISAQMDKLEQIEMKLSKEEAQIKITQMAHNVFKHADEVDRAGNANKQTAAAFNSAFVFYTILKQFGDREENIEKAAKYCMFKTTDILKALKEGRKPKPGGPNEDLENDEDLNAELNAINAADEPASDQPMNGMNGMPQNDQFQPPAQPQQPTYQQPTQPMQPMPPQNYQPQQPQQPVQPQQFQPQQFQPQQPQQPMQQGVGGYMVNSAPNYNYQKRVQFPTFEKKVHACVEAENTLKEALAALRFQDVDTAIKKAEEAITILRPHNQ